MVGCFQGSCNKPDSATAPRTPRHDRTAAWIASPTVCTRRCGPTSWPARWRPATRAVRAPAGRGPGRQPARGARGAEAAASRRASSRSARAAPRACATGATAAGWRSCSTCQAGTEPPADLARSVLELRASVGVDAARRCAERADAATLRARGRSWPSGRPPRSARTTRRSTTATPSCGARSSLGSGNLAYRLALNSLMAALAAYPEVAGVVRPAEPKRVRALGARDRRRPTRRRPSAPARALLEPDIDAFG